MVPKDDEDGGLSRYNLGILTPIFEIQVTQVDKVVHLREDHGVRQVD